MKRDDEPPSAFEILANQEPPFVLPNPDAGERTTGGGESIDWSVVNMNSYTLPTLCVDPTSKILGPDGQPVARKQSYWPIMNEGSINYYYPDHQYYYGTANVFSGATGASAGLAVDYSPRSIAAFTPPSPAESTDDVPRTVIELSLPEHLTRSVVERCTELRVSVEELVTIAVAKFVGESPDPPPPQPPPPTPHLKLVK
jgi:hypothetical protein